jgi:hypothetical protein
MRSSGASLLRRQHALTLWEREHSKLGMRAGERLLQIGSEVVRIFQAD